MGDILSRFANDPAVSTVATAVVSAAIALWLLAALWVHGDAERRTGSALIALGAVAWVLLSTPLLLPLSLAAYAFIRPGEPAGERRVRELTAAYVADSLVAASCSGCGGLVDGAWRRCPSCSTWLAAPCAGCGRWSDSDLSACPWCGESERTRAMVDEPSLLDRRPYVGVPELVGVMAQPTSDGGRGSLAATVTLGLSSNEHGRSHGRSAGRARRPVRANRAWHRRAPGEIPTRRVERGAGGHASARPR